MKVEVTEIKTEKENKFPCLMEIDGTIILRTGETSAIVLKIGNTQDVLFENSDNWFFNDCKKFNGTITLYND